MSDATASPVDLLPDLPLRSRGPLAAAFRALGCHDLRAAATRVWTLPYGRNRDPLDELCVLKQRRGTCSTKHALLARLIDEETIAGIELRLGIYEMSEANTPGVGATLARHGLTSIPEAHCCLVARGARVDLTRAHGAAAEPIGPFLAEQTIRPEQIGEHKRAFHRRFLAARAQARDYGALTADDLWAIREECIAALAEAEPELGRPAV
ncbi:MAG TPA: hypothetical protein VEZ14_07095 [Dehalococcoidia bacterium]|nr:hypothetical protein [Dehalococcoidia bacterium]